MLRTLEGGVVTVGSLESSSGFGIVMKIKLGPPDEVKKFSLVRRYEKFFHWSNKFRWVPPKV